MLITARFWLILWRFIRPEIEELIVYCVAVILFAVTAAYSVIVKAGSPETQDISESISLITQSFTFITNGGDVTAKLLTFGLWFIIGTFVYAITVFLISFASGTFREISVAKHYHHPQNFRSSTYWLVTTSRLSLRVAAAISLFLYTVFWCALVAPVWLASFKSIGLERFNTNAIVDCGLAIIGIGLSLHVAAILIRIMLLKSSYMRAVA